MLAFIAGSVNVVGLLGFEHQSISHLSGTASQFASALAGWSDKSWHLLGILVSFLLGAAVSGLSLSNTALVEGKPYSPLLLLECLLLLLAVWLMKDHPMWGHYAASMACGLQNALATTFSGAIVRTTHVTGIVTDLGIMLGTWLRGDGLDQRKALLFLLIIGGFISGGVAATWLFQQYLFLTLLMPATLCLLLAISYYLLITRRAR
nr:YoaK family protein [Oceanobacter mangrovi]